MNQNSGYIIIPLPILCHVSDSSRGMCSESYIYNNQSNKCNFQLANKLLHTAPHHQRITVFFVTYLSQSYILHHFVMAVPSNIFLLLLHLFLLLLTLLFLLLLFFFFIYFFFFFMSILRDMCCMYASILIVQMRLTAQNQKNRQL